eukprot:Colp12_sorted_trinity150504_noHs@19434
MEGFAFDEDLFEEAIVKKRVVAVATSFKAKQCESEWFLKDGTDETDVEALRHKLDFLFYRKKFEDCLLVASSLLQKYTSSDLNYREILEVKTRCLVHTGRLRDAYEASTELVGACTLREQENFQKAYVISFDRHKLRLPHVHGLCTAQLAHTYANGKVLCIGCIFLQNTLMIFCYHYDSGV